MRSTVKGYKVLTISHCFLGAPIITSLRTSGYSGTVRLTCQAKGDPNPVLSWQFNGATIDTNSRYEFKYGNLSMVTIKDTTPSDSGKYRCIATNHLGSIFQEIVVKIKGELKIGREFSIF